MGSNLTETVLQRAAHSVTSLQTICEQYDCHVSTTALARSSQRVRRACELLNHDTPTTTQPIEHVFQRWRTQVGGGTAAWKIGICMWPQRNPVYLDGCHEGHYDAYHEGHGHDDPGTCGIGTDAVPEEVRFIVFM